MRALRRLSRIHFESVRRYKTTKGPKTACELPNQQVKVKCTKGFAIFQPEYNVTLVCPINLKRNVELWQLEKLLRSMSCQGKESEVQGL